VLRQQLDEGIHQAGVSRATTSGWRWQTAHIRAVCPFACSAALAFRAMLQQEFHGGVPLRDASMSGVPPV
jgi:hypothetical protein